MAHLRTFLSFGNGRVLRPAQESLAASTAHEPVLVVVTSEQGHQAGE